MLSISSCPQKMFVIAALVAKLGSQREDPSMKDEVGAQ